VAHSHDHANIHVHQIDRPAQRRALRWALGVNGVFLVVEVIGGIAFDSLALLADAVHMLTDVGALVVALVALRLASRPSTQRHTFGLERAEVLGALVNGLALLVASGWIVFEALRRLGSPPDVDAGGVLVVASIGLVINVVSAVALAKPMGRSLNMRGAVTHMVMDAIGSAGAIVAAVAILVADATWADPAVSIGIALLVAWSGFRLLADTIHVLLEGTPEGMDRDEVEATLLAADDIDAVHHLHLWSLASDVPALSAHVVIRGEVSLHEAQQRGEELKHLLAERHGIAHATLELECHACEDDTH
jgi:cobalt-zinc-cadmium efflux system protein